jgi:hypothetical protein
MTFLERRLTDTGAGGFSARFFFHEPKGNAVKKKQKA